MHEQLSPHKLAFAERSGHPCTLALSTKKGHPQPSAAFTLIEVLVVVAIIALLVAILMPSLAAARNISKITVCQVNCKQIATYTALYQSEFRDYVPVLFNDAIDPRIANVAPGTATPTPARTMAVSLGFRKYNQRTRNLPRATLDPEIYWTNAQWEEYETKWLPEVYVCPFQRGSGRKVSRQVSQNGSGDDPWRYELYGRFDCAFFGLRDVEAATGVDRGKDYRSQFVGLNWNRLYDGLHSPALTDASNRNLKNEHRRWSEKDVQKLGGASLSDAYVSFCESGEWIVLYGGHQICNMNSHRKAESGGTNALFADSHVQWVKGCRIGSQ